MKISKLELALLLLTVGFLAFVSGWFLRGNGAAQPVRIEVERTLSPEEPPLVLPAPSAPAEKKVNINTASAEELETLPGIGEKRAQDIIAYREQNGPFRIPEDITKVKGIGESTLAELLDRICTE